jgi:hypothetical protein
VYAFVRHIDAYIKATVFIESAGRRFNIRRMIRFNHYHSRRRKPIPAPLPLRPAKRKAEGGFNPRTQYSVRWSSIFLLKCKIGYIKRRISNKTRREYATEFTVCIGKSAWWVWLYNQRRPWPNRVKRTSKLLKWDVSRKRAEWDAIRLRELERYLFDRKEYSCKSRKTWEAFRDVQVLADVLIGAIDQNRKIKFKPLRFYEDELFDKVRKRLSHIGNTVPPIPPPGRISSVDALHRLANVQKGKPGSGIRKRIIGDKKNLHIARIKVAGHGYVGSWFIKDSDTPIPGREKDVSDNNKLGLTHKQAERINWLLQKNTGMSRAQAIKIMGHHRQATTWCGMTDDQKKRMF